MARHAIRGQFIKPGFIDSRYNKHKNLAEIALAYEQSGPDTQTGPLSVRVRENRLHALALNAEDAALPV